MNNTQKGQALVLVAIGLTALAIIAIYTINGQQYRSINDPFAQQAREDFENAVESLGNDQVAIDLTQEMIAVDEQLLRFTITDTEYIQLFADAMVLQSTNDHQLTTASGGVLTMHLGETCGNWNFFVPGLPMMDETFCRTEKMNVSDPQHPSNALTRLFQKLSTAKQGANPETIRRIDEMLQLIHDVKLSVLTKLLGG